MAVAAAGTIPNALARTSQSESTAARGAGGSAIDSLLTGASSGLLASIFRTSLPTSRQNGCWQPMLPWTIPL